MLLASTAAFAGPLLTFTFTTTPPTQSAHPGETLGFNYTITNLDAERFLVVDSIDPITNVPGQITWDSTPFLLPIIAPSNFDSGLFANFTLDPLIPAGSGPFLGDFVINVQWYIGDPLIDGSPTGGLESASSAYQVNLLRNDLPGEIPEPATFAMMASGLLAAGFFARRKRA